jgi:hypothetical protein
MKGRRKLSDDEIEALHAELVEFVDSHWVSNQNPDLHLQPFGECDVGMQALTCEVLDANTLRIGNARASLQERFPGADVYVEKTPTGNAYFKLEVPLWVEQDIISNHRSARFSSASQPPSPVLGMFLFMTDLLLATVLYLRLT